MTDNFIGKAGADSLKDATERKEEIDFITADQVIGNADGRQIKRNYQVPSVEEFVPIIEKAFEENMLSATASQTELLARYIAWLLSVNRVFNLTAICDPVEAVYKHLCDSAKVVDHIKVGSNLIDVGSGAGLPAFPIAILRPDVTVTALDSTAKKTRFIFDTTTRLGLKNVRVLTGRAEELGRDERFRGYFDTVTARAVARLNVLAEICMPFIKKGGNFLALKSRLTPEEVPEAHRAVTALGGKVEEIDSFNLIGVSDAERSIVRIRKTASTPARYPRVYSVISSNPL